MESSNQSFPRKIHLVDKLVWVHCRGVPLAL